MYHYHIKIRFLYPQHKGYGWTSCYE